MKKSLIIILLVFLIYPSFSQFKGVSISAGLSNIWILGDNPAAKPIFERDTSKPFIIGGGFGGVQPGTALIVSFAIDEKEKFTIPVGFDYYFFDSRERIPISKNTNMFIKHNIYMPAISLGLNYKFFKIPYSDVSLFAGLDAKTFFVNSGYWYRLITYPSEDLNDLLEIRTKESTIRFGGQAYLGFEGAILKPIYINVLYGLGVMNLVGKDDKRLELLTPRKDFETGESTVYNSYFSLTLKYKF